MADQTQVARFRDLLRDDYRSVGLFHSDEAWAAALDRASDFMDDVAEEWGEMIDEAIEDGIDPFSPEVREVERVDFAAWIRASRSTASGCPTSSGASIATSRMTA